MTGFLSFLTILNFFGLLYLTYLISKKIKTTTKNTPADLTVPKPYKINLLRFNPFGDLGGDQSFVLCLLDNTNSGVIITSLHTRESTRVYAKAIKHGQSDSSALSKEETQALIKTINS